MNRNDRVRKPPTQFSLNCVIDISEPLSYQDATTRDDSFHWLKAMKEEINSLKENHTWTLSQLPPGRKAIRSKWVYKIKHDANGNINRYKARLVAVGCSQTAGIDFEETFSPVVRWETVRLCLAHCLHTGIPAIHLDIASAYLYGIIDKEIYMVQPEGFEEDSTKVCKLLKSIYGLKQSGKIWNETLSNVIIKKNYKQSKSDPCLFFKDNLNLVLVYVDDIILIGENKELLNILESTFTVRNLGQLSYFLNVKIEFSKFEIKFSQHNYTNKILSKFGMSDCKPVNTPMVKIALKNSPNLTTGPYQEAVGSLIYLATISRPDILFSVVQVISHWPPLVSRYIGI